MSSTPKKSAETLFREAFERLKSNQPEVLHTNTPVSQNSVAKEARRDPSALKKSRFPSLILEIQEYVATESSKKNGKKNTYDNRKKPIENKLEDAENQLMKALSICRAQEEYIVELNDETDIHHLT